MVAVAVSRVSDGVSVVGVLVADVVAGGVAGVVMMSRGGAVAVAVAVVGVGVGVCVSGLVVSAGVVWRVGVGIADAGLVRMTLVLASRAPSPVSVGVVCVGAGEVSVSVRALGRVLVAGVGVPG